MIKVGINGYGTIGKRVAEAIKLQPDMKLIGVTKATPNYEAYIAYRRNIPIYVPTDSLKKFEEAGIKVNGTIEDLFREAEIIVDATPNGVGAQYKQIYQNFGKNAIFQGGEKSNVADISFSSLCNYDEAYGKKYIRVVSCNTTGLLRTICIINSISKVKKVRATIVRRAADPKEVKRGPINSLIPDPASIPSHHAKDVQTVIKDLDIITMAVVAPTTLMHLHLINIEVSNPVDKKDLVESFLNTPRFVLISNKSQITSTAEIMEAVRDLGRYRNDLMEIAVFEDSIYSKGNEIFLMYAVHQESIVVPENIDAIRASLKIKTKEDSINTTNETLGLMRGYLL
jgi:glyceraldehyde-3-phosphate dehydrogenase (NAD(P))